MTQETGTAKQLTSVKCEQHGLRYNPNVHTGCVRCRKEAGEQIGTAPPQPSVAVTAGVIPTRTTQSRLMPSLAVTAILIALTGGTLFWAHSQFVSRVEQMELDSGFDPNDFDPNDFNPDDFDPNELLDQDD